MDAISVTILSNAFSWMEVLEIWSRINKNLFRRVQHYSIIGSDNDYHFKKKPQKQAVDENEADILILTKYTGSYAPFKSNPPPPPRYSVLKCLHVLFSLNPW